MKSISSARPSRRCGGDVRAAIFTSPIGSH
jgi:hypothetical protein